MNCIDGRGRPTATRDILQSRISEFPRDPYHLQTLLTGNMTPENRHRISVIVPTYNIERHICQTLDAVLAQRTAHAIELIVVDDGSTDDTVNILRSYNDRIKLIVQANQGRCRARNRGFEASTGDLVCFLDHDDWWHPDKVELQVRALDGQQAAGVCYTDFRLWEQQPSGDFAPANAQTLAALPNPTPGTRSGWIYHELLIDNWVLLSTAMFRREALMNCGVFLPDLDYSEDWELCLRISQRYQFVQLQEPLVLYRQMPTQGSKKVRNTDYRVDLLQSAARRWGLCSPDGKRISRVQFHRRLASYSYSHGRHLLAARQWRVAARSLLKAWWLWPLDPKPLLVLAGSLAGWQPH